MHVLNQKTAFGGLAVLLLVTTLSPSRSLGQSTALFAPAVNYALPYAANVVAVGDFNGDGKPDVLVVMQGYSTTGSIGVLLGNGDGTLQPVVATQVGNTPMAVVVADFNGDGKDDVAVVDALGGALGSGDLRILLSNGDGTFQPAIVYAGGGYPDFVAAGDFNGDGKLDLAVLNAHGGSTGKGNGNILLGNGDGTFQAPTNFPSGYGPVLIAVGDFNSDGILDLAVTASAIELNLFLGTGNGTFQAPLTYQIGHGAVSMVATDVNGDGKLDLLLGNGANVAEALGNGDGTFQPTQIIKQPMGFIAVEGFDGTMVPSIAGSYAGSGWGTAVLLGEGDGRFKPPLIFNPGQPNGPLVVADFNLDGKQDVAVTESATLSVLINTAAPAASLSAASLGFGDQTVGSVSPSQILHLTNPGYEPLSISSVAVMGEFVLNNHCGSSLAEGASCGIDVAFKPTSALKQSGTVTITDNASGSPQTASLSGTGTFIALAPTSLNFGTVQVGQSSAPQTVTVTNVATRAVSIVTISVTEAYPETNTCGSSLPAKSNCTVTVTFSPQTTGTQTGLLAVYDNGGGSPQTVSLTGIGD